jgi:hypothetical protein
MTTQIIDNNGSVLWEVKRSLWRRQCHHVYKVEGKKHKWVASFRDRDDALYWVRFGTEEPAQTLASVVTRLAPRSGDQWGEPARDPPKKPPG